MRPHLIISAIIQAILGMSILTSQPDSEITDLAALDGLGPLERLGILEEILATGPSITERDIDATLKSLIPYLGEEHYFGVLMILNLMLEKGCPVTPNLINFSTKYPDLQHPNLLQAKANFNQSQVLSNLQRIPAIRRVIILPQLRNVTTTPIISTKQVHLPNIGAGWFDDVLALSWNNPKEAYHHAFLCLRNGANPNSPCANGMLPLDCVLNNIDFKLMRKLFALILCTFDGRFNSQVHDPEIIREIYPLQRKVQALRYFFIYFNPIFSVSYGLERVRDSIFNSALHFILKQD